MYKLYDILTEAKKLDINDIVDYINQFDSWEDFRKSNKFATYQQNIINNYKNDPKYNWNTLVAPLKAKSQEKNKATSDIEDIKIISSNYPQYNFDNATFFYKNIEGKNRKYLNGLYCSKIDPVTRKLHGYSDDLRVSDLKSKSIIGCRKCGEDNKKYDITKEIESFPKEKGYKFDPKNFYYKGEGSSRKLYVKDVICTKHNPPLTFYENGVIWQNLKRGKGGCPICETGKSKGEKKVYEELQKLGYNNIITEKTFPGANGCYGYKGQRHCDLLRFDAYVVKDGNEICIEFDGAQHYEPTERHGGEEGLKAIQERDRAKTEYCKKNGIKLIRIPYNDYNKIDEILEKEVGPNNTTNETQYFKKPATIRNKDVPSTNYYRGLLKTANITKSQFDQINNVLDNIDRNNKKATEKEYTLLQALKTGNFKYSTKN